MGPWFDASRSEREAAFHEELDRLPRVDRTAIILCGLEGRSIEASRAGRCDGRWGDSSDGSPGGIERLRLRMACRYYGITPGAWDSRILQVPEAIVPESLMQVTVAAATGQAVPDLAGRSANTGRTVWR